MHKRPCLNICYFAIFLQASLCGVLTVILCWPSFFRLLRSIKDLVHNLLQAITEAEKYRAQIGDPSEKEGALSDARALYDEKRRALADAEGVLPFKQNYSEIVCE